jgi:hypothetical protein
MTPFQFANSIISEAEASGHALDDERNALREISIARQSMLEQKEEESREQNAKAQAFLTPQALERNDSGTASEPPPLPPFDLRRTERGSRFVEHFSSDSPRADTKQASNVFVIGSDDEEDDIEVAVDPISSTWGTGKGIAALYHAM